MFFFASFVCAATEGGRTARLAEATSCHVSARTLQVKPVWRHSVRLPPPGRGFLLAVLVVQPSQYRQVASAGPRLLIMAHSHSSFSALNERLRPRLSASDRLYSSLYRMEYGYAGSLKPLPSTYRQTILPPEPEPEPEVSEASSDPEEPGEDAAPEVSTAEQACTGPSQLTEIDKISEEPDDEDSRMSPSEEKDVPGELVSKATDASTQSSTSKPDNSYIDGTLPDLIRSGRPLGRRRTLGHVSETVGRSTSFCPCLIFEGLGGFILRSADWDLLQFQPSPFVLTLNKTVLLTRL